MINEDAYSVSYCQHCLLNVVTSLSYTDSPRCFLSLRGVNDKDYSHQVNMSSHHHVVST